MTIKTTKKARKPASNSRLTLGPLFFNWPADKRRDFYFRIADEADIDTVYIGEVVCSKREKFYQDAVPEIVTRLKRAKKEVILSTLALVTSQHEMAEIEDKVGESLMVEANDVACLAALDGKPHVVGPFINVFNESARDYFIRNGAKRIVLPVEMPAASMKVLAAKSPAETEVLVFGRQPLAVAMRCYHARAYDLKKDGCRIVCGNDPDGLPIQTLDKQPILTTNGTQTLSHGYGVLLRELAAMQKMGVTHFRLSPQDVDMLAVAKIYRGVLDRKVEAASAMAKLKKITGAIPYVNGFYYGKEGLGWID